MYGKSLTCCWRDKRSRLIKVIRVPLVTTSPADCCAELSDTSTTWHEGDTSNVASSFHKMNYDERCLKTHQAVQLPWFLLGIPWWLHRLGRLSCSWISDRDCQVKLSLMRMTWLWRFPSKSDDWQARPAIKYGLVSVPGWRTDAVSWEVSLGFDGRWRRWEFPHTLTTHIHLSTRRAYGRTPQSLGLSIIWYRRPSRQIGWRRIPGMPNNSPSRAVHALLIATPTVAATGELVSERSRPLPSPCLLWRKHRWGGVSVTQRKSVHQGNRYKAHSRCCWCDLCACCSNINTPNEKLNQHISPSSNRTYINILNMALT